MADFEGENDFTIPKSITKEEQEEYELLMLRMDNMFKNHLHIKVKNFELELINIACNNFYSSIETA